MKKNEAFRTIHAQRGFVIDFCHEPEIAVLKLPARKTCLSLYISDYPWFVEDGEVIAITT